MAQITPKTDEQKLAIIADRLKFAEANKGVPYLFKVSSGYDKALTDAKDKQMAQGNYLLPGIYYLNYAKPGEEINKHIVIYKGADNVTESHKIYRNSVGKFEEPIDIKPIVFEDFQMAVYGDSLPNLRLIEYLSLVEMFDGVVHCKDLTEAFKNSQPTEVLSMENAVKMSLLIDETAKTDAGFEIIKTIAKNTKLNEAWQAVDGLALMEGGKEQIVSLVKQFLLNSVKSKLFVAEFSPSQEAVGLAKALKEKGILTYSEKTKGFHLKDDKEVLFAVDSPNESVREFLFARQVARMGELKIKLQNILSELSK